jgi:hypothetical protein
LLCVKHSTYRKKTQTKFVSRNKNSVVVVTVIFNITVHFMAYGLLEYKAALLIGAQQRFRRTLQVVA